MDKLPHLNQLLVDISGTIQDALAQIDNNALGICFVVNADNTIQGVLTDGDLRRALLSDKSLSTSLSEIVKGSFVSLPVDSKNLDILSHLDSKIKVIPLVNEENQVVDYASANKLRYIPVAEPSLNGNELNYVADCIRTTWISSRGEYIDRFQDQFKECCNSEHALAVSNGTVALHLAVEALRITTGDEVIVPNLTFAASINAIIYAGATPVLADIDTATLNIDVDQIESLITDKTKAIMVVHLYGYPCDMETISAIAKKHNLLVIEDCAEALGSKFKGQPVGSFGDAATFSFFGNKTITTGEGGMVIFKNKDVADYAGVLKDHGMNKSKRYWHDVVGYNYRMTNLQAAVGVAQMERLDEFVNHKRALAQTYSSILQTIPGLQVPDDSADYFNSFWLYTLLLPKEIDRDKVISHMYNNAIEPRQIFYPLHIMPPYHQYVNGQQFPASEEVFPRGLSLPSFSGFSLKEAEYVASVLTEAIEKQA